jgi:hypothetical protein
MEDVKLFLAGLEEGVLVTIAPETLQVIGYLDAQLPPETSCWFSVNNSELTPERLFALYPESPRNA